MLVASKLSVTLSGRTILPDMSLTLRPGELTIIVGPNGAGKSTLLKALTGTLHPSAGQVMLDGRPIATWPRHDLARRRAVLSQGQHLAFPFTVFEVVALGAGLLNAKSAAGTRRRVLDCLKAVDLVGFEGRLFQQLSGGEQQRVQIARVLCQLDGALHPEPRTAPTWLFLDEPTASLDIAHQLSVLDIAQRHAHVGNAAVAILHDLNLAALYADRLVLLTNGRIVADAAPAMLGEDVFRSVFGDRISLVRSEMTGKPSILPRANA